MGDNLKQKMIGALAWSTIDRFGQQAVQLVIGMILARLLSPDDYGLLGMVMIFAALSFVLVESGFGQALIRKTDATETDYNTIFYFNIGVSVSLYLILFFSVPQIAVFLNQPKLIPVGRIIFLAIVFNALYLVPITKLGKIMDFKTIAKVNLISVLLSGITGIILAVFSFGVWALVAQQVLYHFFRMVSLHIFVRWKPQLIFSFKVIKEFWSFSIHLLGTSVLNVIFNNLYILVLSRFYPIKHVGYYSQANKLNETFNFSFQAILVGSTYSLFAQIQNDDVRFRRIFREIAQKTSIVTFPIMLVLIAIAQPLIFVLLSEKWLPAVPFFQILCLASLFSPLYTLNINALNARGESKKTFQIELLKKGLILISLIVSFNWGIIAMLWGYALSSLVSYLISMTFLKKSIMHYIKHQATDTLNSLITGSSLAIVAYLLSFLISNLYVLFFTQLISVLVLYTIIIRSIYPQLYKKAYLFLIEKIRLITRK